VKKFTLELLINVQLWETGLGLPLWLKIELNVAVEAAMVFAAKIQQCYLQIMMIGNIHSTVVVSCSSLGAANTLSSDDVFVQKYLVRQNELGFQQFRQTYGNLQYNKIDSEEPAPEVQVMSSLLFDYSNLAADK